MAQLVIYDDFVRGAPVAGLTPGQLAILLLIEQNPGLTQQTLCDGMHIEKSTLVVRLHRLAERGLLRRVRSHEDRRQNTLELTAEGKQALRTMLAFVRQHEERLLAAFSATERKQLMKALSKIVIAGVRGRAAGSGRAPEPRPAPAKGSRSSSRARQHS